MSAIVHSYAKSRGPRQTFLRCARCPAEIKRGRKYCGPCSVDQANELKQRARLDRQAEGRREAAEEAAE